MERSATTFEPVPMSAEQTLDHQVEEQVRQMLLGRVVSRDVIGVAQPWITIPAPVAPGPILPPLPVPAPVPAAVPLVSFGPGRGFSLGRGVGVVPLPGAGLGRGAGRAPW